MDQTTLMTHSMRLSTHPRKGDEAYREADARPYHEHAEQVAPVGVGAEQIGAAFDLGHAAHGQGYGLAGQWGGEEGVARDTIFIVYGQGGVGQGSAVQHVAPQGGLLVEVDDGGAAEGLEGGEFEVLLVAVGCWVGGYEVAEHGDEGEEAYDHHAGYGQGVAAQAVPGLSVEAGAGQVGGGAAAEGVSHGFMCG